MSRAANITLGISSIYNTNILLSFTYTLCYCLYIFRIVSHCYINIYIKQRNVMLELF